MNVQCIRKVSVTKKRCCFKAEMADDCAWFMCDNQDFTHFFSLYDLVAFESREEV